jgi:hypothetical protein
MPDAAVLDRWEAARWIAVGFALQWLEWSRAAYLAWLLLMDGHKDQAALEEAFLTLVSRMAGGSEGLQRFCAGLGVEPDALLSMYAPIREAMDSDHILWGIEVEPDEETAQAVDTQCRDYWTRMAGTDLR